MARPRKKSLLAEGFAELVDLLRTMHSKLDAVIKQQKKSGRGPGRPPKSGRGPGRPPKSGRGPGRPPKSGRGPGRPPKSGRGPGRPPKSGRGPGRPPKNAATTAPAAAGNSAKRGRGRPLGSKNKKK